MKNFFCYLSSVFLVFFLSGCQLINSAIEIKSNTLSQVEELRLNIQEIQDNIEEKKLQIEEKIAQIEAAQKAVSDVFNTPSFSELQADQNILNTLQQEKDILHTEIQELEAEEQMKLKDISEFSIE